MSTRPGIVFACQFVQADVAKANNVEFGNHAIGYLDRAEARLQNENGSELPTSEVVQGHSIHYGFNKYANHATGYLGRQKATKEESAGVFTGSKDSLNKQERQQIRETFNRSQQRGCPLYTTVISFDNDFLIKNGIDYRSPDGQKKLRDYTRLGVAHLIKNSQFDPMNVTYTAAIHYNTDNIHVHVDLVEYQKVDRQKDMLPVKAMDALKSAIANKIADNQYTVLLSQSLRKDLISEIRAVSKDDMAALDELIHILPGDVKWQYNRAGMQAFQPQIDAAVDRIIASTPSLSKAWDDATQQLESYRAFIVELYGEGERDLASKAVDNKLADFYARAGNALLQELDELREADAARTEREKNDVPTEEQVFEDQTWLEERAFIKHDPGALYRVGRNVELGYGYKKDPEMAAKIFATAVYYGSDTAAYHLGWMYEHNKDMTDYRMSAYWYGKAASCGHHAAQYRLGRLHQYGRLGGADLSLASILYEKAAVDNPAAIKQLLSMHRYHQIELTENELQHYQKQLFGLYKIRAEADPENASVNLDLGKMYLHGIGTAPSLTDAIYHFGEASLAGNEEATSELILLANNDAVYAELRQAMDAGDPMAPICYKLVEHYRNGRAAPHDRYDDAYKSALEDLKSGNYSAAAEKLTRSKQAGNALASYELGRMYQLGLGVERNSIRSDMLYESARQGLASCSSAQAKYALGNMYRLGLGGAMDTQRAAELYEQAASGGHIAASCELGKLYLRGGRVEEGEQLLAKAADSYLPAQLALGIHYRQTDREELAIPYLQRAADAGNAYARWLLEPTPEDEAAKRKSTSTSVKPSMRSTLRTYQHRYSLKRAIRRLQADYEQRVHSLKAEFEYEQDLQIYQSQIQNNQSL